MNPHAATPLSPASRISLGAMLALVLFYAVSSVRWGLTDQQPPMWDQARHAWDALRFLQSAKDVMGGQGKWGDLGVWHDNYYVFMAYLPTAMAHAVFGPSFEVAKVLMALFWTPMAFLSTGYVAWRLLGSMHAATAAVAWLGCSPMMADLAKDYLIDLPILSLLALSMALVLRSDFLRIPGWSAAAGVATGCIVLVKAVAPMVFVVAPALVTFGYLVKTRGFKDRVKGLLAALATWTFCAVPVHVRWWPEFMMARQWQQQHSVEEGDPQQIWESAVVVVKHLVDIQARGVMLPWLVLGCVLLWKTHRHVVLMALAAFGFCEVVWTWYPNKDVRFEFPGLVYLAVPAGAVLIRMKEHLQTRVAAALCGVAVFFTWVVQWNVSFLPQELALSEGWRLFAQIGYLRGRPDPTPSVPLALMRPTHRNAELLAATQGTRIPRANLNATLDEPFFSNWSLAHVGWMLDHSYDMDDVEAETYSALDYAVFSRCGDETLNVPAGYVLINSATTPKGCRAQLFRNDALHQAETRLRNATPVKVTYKAQHMVQTIQRVDVGAQPWVAGQTATVALLVFIDNDRWNRSMQRTLTLGGVPLKTFTSLDLSHRRGGTYVVRTDVVVPADLATGSYELTLSTLGPEGPAKVLAGDGQTVDGQVVRLGQVTVAGR